MPFGTPGIEKPEWLSYPMVKKFLKISLFVLTELTNVTDTAWRLKPHLMAKISEYLRKLCSNEKGPVVFWLTVYTETLFWHQNTLLSALLMQCMITEWLNLTPSICIFAVLFITSCCSFNASSHCPITKSWGNQDICSGIHHLLPGPLKL